VRALMQCFRGRLAALLHRSLDAGDLVAPGGDEREWHTAIWRAQRKKWNVRLEQRYDHARGVAVYLARYVRGGPIRNHQVHTANDRVRLSYYDHRQNPKGSRDKLSSMSFSSEQFLKRYLQHAPEKRRKVVRTYGLYAHRCRDRLNTARELHHQAPLEDSVPLTWETFMVGVTGEDFLHCPECQQLLIKSALPPRQQGPPLA
jgi:hypothetical protein